MAACLVASSNRGISFMLVTLMSSEVKHSRPRSLAELLNQSSLVRRTRIHSRKTHWLLLRCTLLINMSSDNDSDEKVVLVRQTQSQSNCAASTSSGERWRELWEFSVSLMLTLICMMCRLERNLNFSGTMGAQGNVNCFNGHQRQREVWNLTVNVAGFKVCSTEQDCYQCDSLRNAQLIECAVGRRGFKTSF